MVWYIMCCYYDCTHLTTLQNVVHELFVHYINVQRSLQILSSGSWSCSVSFILIVWMSDEATPSETVFLYSSFFGFMSMLFMENTFPASFSV